MRRTGRVIFFIVALAMVWLVIGLTGVEELRYDVVVVGAGISGLAATWELARSGVDVAVLEMSPHYGGAALVSEGSICIIGTPEQTQAGMPDSPKIAFEDFIEYGRDEHGYGPNVEWVRYYVAESRREIYDWLTGLGVRFEKDVVLMPDNREPRWHQVVGRGRGLVKPIYRECVRSSNVTFFWSTKAVSLLRDGDRIRGVRANRLSDGVRIDFLAPIVILATGGFQNNLEMVRKYWPKGLLFLRGCCLAPG